MHMRRFAAAGPRTDEPERLEDGIKKETVDETCTNRCGPARSAPLLASAQSVTLYGVVDTGVEYVSNVGANGYGLTRVPNNTATVPSRWGLRGTEDLGGGLKSIFVLESGFAPDTGSSNQGGRLFGRQALVGLSNQYGQLSFGRQYTMLFWATLDSDILGPNVYGSGSLDSYLPNTRADNAVSYKGTFGGVTVAHLQLRPRCSQCGPEPRRHQLRRREPGRQEGVPRVVGHGAVRDQLVGRADRV